MKKYYEYLLDYFKHYYNKKLYLFTAFLLLFLLVLEIGFDIRDRYISPYHGSYAELPFYFLLQWLPYICCCYFIYKYTPCKAFFKQNEFWVLNIAIFLILAHYRSFYWDRVISQSLDPEISRFAYKAMANLFDVILIVIPLYVFFVFWDKKYLNHFYGLQTKGVSWGVYGYFMAGMAVLVWLASYNSDFQAYYPTYKRVGGTEFSIYYNISEVWAFIIYECCYALKFISVELFFRGILVFSMLRFMGGYAILPMAVSYCVLHFGKPYGETVSSIFGGYLLGIFAYYSRNIYGGIAVHMGIAVLMDIAAYVQMKK